MWHAPFAFELKLPQHCLVKRAPCGIDRSSDEGGLGETAVATAMALAPLSRAVSPSLAVSFAFVSIILFALMAKGLTGVLCTVTADISREEGSSVRLELIEFTFRSMVSDFLEAGAWLIAVLIVAGSLFPLLKIAFLFVIWTCPIPCLTPYWRHHILLVLDFVGHTFCANMIFIGVVIVCLSQTIRVGGSLEVTLAAELSSEGIWYGGGVAVAIQILGQLVLAAEPRTIQVEPRARLILLRDELPRSAVVSCMLLGLAFFLCLGYGLTELLAVFEFGGAAGILIDHAETFTGLTVLTELPLYTPDARAGALFFSVVLSFVLVVLPVLTALISLACWVVPLTPRSMRVAVVMIERLFCWCSLDILVVGMIAAVMEVNLVAQFALKNEFNTLCDEILPSTAIGDCVTLEGSMRIGGPLLGCAALSLIALALMTRWYAKSVLDDTEAMGKTDWIASGQRSLIEQEEAGLKSCTAAVYRSTSSAMQVSKGKQEELTSEVGIHFVSAA